MHNQSKEIQSRLNELAIRQRDEEKSSELGNEKRLRQIPEDTGNFLALLASVAPPGELYEFGTSGAYSSLWISTGIREKERVLHTCEVLDDKILLAQETIRRTHSEHCIKLYQRDGLAHAHAAHDLAFAFIDTPSEHYLPILQIILPKMVSGGIIVADNATSHVGELREFLRFAAMDPRLQSRIIDIGKGELVAVVH